VGTGYSQLNLTGGGSINLNSATLGISLNYAPPVTDSFLIINGGPVTGTFLGLPNNANVILGTFLGNQYKATIVYAANSVSLVSPTPEPATILGACAAAAGAVSVWRRRRITSRSAAPADTPVSC
jgi:hypothetical protein